MLTSWLHVGPITMVGNIKLTLPVTSVILIKYNNGAPELRAPQQVIAENGAA